MRGMLLRAWSPGVTNRTALQLRLRTFSHFHLLTGLSAVRLTCSECWNQSGVFSILTLSINRYPEKLIPRAIWLHWTTQPMPCGIRGQYF